LEQHPQLTLGQIFSALAYDWDHQSEMDVLLAADELETERLLDRVELEGKVEGNGKCFLEISIQQKLINSTTTQSRNLETIFSASEIPFVVKAQNEFS
jgi:hypothetical protein